MTADASEQTSGKRERSARYPAAPLEEAIDFCRQIDSLGVDGLSAGQIATAMGYKNVKTNTFSGRLSSARQFGLLDLADQSHNLTHLAKRIIHPLDPDEIPTLIRQACQSPPLFAELIKQYAGKRLPEPEILGNLLMHRYQITASAKSAAAESFFATARYAGILNENRQLDELSDEPAIVVEPKAAGIPVKTTKRFQGTSSESQITTASRSEPQARKVRERTANEDEVRFDLSLWDEDHGKYIRLRAPSMMSQASYDRFLQAFQLAIRITPTTDSDSDVK